MTKAEYTELKKLIPNKNIVIVTHKNPDGDAIGSSLALYGYLKNFTEQVSVVVPNDFPEFLKWMPGADEIIIFEEKKSPYPKFYCKQKLFSPWILITILARVTRCKLYYHRLPV